MTTSQTIDVVMKAIRSTTQPERGELIRALIDAIKEEYCIDCGSDDPYCPCWNDE